MKNTNASYGFLMLLILQGFFYFIFKEDYSYHRSPSSTPTPNISSEKIYIDMHTHIACVPLERNDLPKERELDEECYLSPEMEKNFKFDEC